MNAEGVAVPFGEGRGDKWKLYSCDRTGACEKKVKFRISRVFECGERFWWRRGPWGLHGVLGGGFGLQGFRDVGGVATLDLLGKVTHAS